jgi:hypothetical protein
MMLLKKMSRLYAMTNECTVTFIVDDAGKLQLDAIGHRTQYCQFDVNHILAQMVNALDRRVNCIEPATVTEKMSEITARLASMKRAVIAIENSYLNPYTRMGRKRLMKEFELIICDDAM